MPAPSARLQQLAPYVFAVINQDIQRLVMAGHDVIRLDIGSPDLPPPDDVVATLAAHAARPDAHGYTGYRGTAAFRQAVADVYAARFGVTLDPNTEVLPLLGSKEGIVNLTLAYLGPGDVALVPEVGYPSYVQGAHLAMGTPHVVPLDPATYLPDLASLPTDVLARAKLLWVNYPNNPTGAGATLDDYAAWVAFARAHDLLLASDNPYMDVTFDDHQAPSALQVPGARDVTVEFMSLSKSYNMAGWRLGAAVGQREAIARLLQVKSNVDSGHFAPVYEAGVRALQTPQAWVAARNARYQARRDRVLAALPALGLEAQSPIGALYVWARVLRGDALDYVRRALNEAHVSLAPGAAYGPGGESFVRLSLGVADDRLDEALTRLHTLHAQPAPSGENV